MEETSHQSSENFCDVEQLKSILKSSEDDPSLLKSLHEANAKQRNKPLAYFTFPGTRGSMISLPPFLKWPIQLGWSFSTWLNLQPKPCGQPYLYNFKTSKSGLGYSAHFTGDCLVLTSIRVKGKGVQHCVAYEFPTNKWIHCAITYHNKWRASEIKVYINGQLAANIQMPWQVQTTEIFDRCFIGGAGITTTSSTSSTSSITANNNERSDEINCFSGHMSAIYLFNEGLSPAQICAIHRLGPSYMGQFKYSNESYVYLPPQITKALYEEKLASTLFCLFTPVAVDSGTLCIQLAPFKSSTTVSAQNYFISAPHAALSGQTKAIITQPINSTLQSLGCSRSLLPLLDTFASMGDAEACASLISFLCDLLETSPHWFANDIVQNNGFVVVACSLASNPRLLLSEKLLDIFIRLTRTLLTTSTTAGDALLLKHLLDNILFNPSLWIYADTNLQIKLYSYLATEFLHGTRHTTNKYTITNSKASFVPYNPTTNAAMAHSSNQNYLPREDSNEFDSQAKTNSIENTSSVVSDLLFGEIRRVSTVLQSLHALKYYYWISEEKGINPKGRNYKLRPNNQELLIIRSHILRFTKELICRANATPLDEIQGLLNYLSSCTHSENLIDVLDLLSSMLENDPAQIVSALDQKQGIKVLFILIGSQHEKVRVKSLKLLALFLANCTNKKKQENMSANNLFMLLCDRLSVYKPMSLEVYEALMDILLESDESRAAQLQKSDTPQIRDLSKWRIENSIIIKVIATLIHDERIHSSSTSSEKNSLETSPTNNLRRIFINDLWSLIVGSKENRRIILQMSVWQHWLINLIDNTMSDSQLVMDQILAIFRVLLYHAIRYEYGGWRVWIDTLAILHTKVSYDEFCQQLSSSDSVSRPPRHPYGNQLKSDSLVSPNKSAIKEQEEKQTEICSKTNSITDINETADKAADKDTCEQDTTNIQQQPVVSSISETIPRESSGIQMDDAKSYDEVDAKIAEVQEQDKQVDGDGGEKTVEKEEDHVQASESPAVESSIDTVDLAPSREFRKLSLQKVGIEQQQPISDVEPREGSETSHAEVSSQQSMTSIPLEEPSSQDSDTVEDETKYEDNSYGASKEESCPDKIDHSNQKVTNANQDSNVQTSKATASPAFRIPEFKWGNVLIKLLNDVMFSIECDLYHWRCLAKCTNLDMLPFTPKTAASAQASTNPGNSSKSIPATTLKIETILQRPENQIYIINIVHFVSQLSDNVIIASGGLLPLLADATGGSRSTSTSTDETSTKNTTLCEGLTAAQANSILYRLVNMVDIVIFAASHVNLAELEADKNTTSGGILRQCLRLACTVTVKNCLVVRSIHNKISSMGIGGGYVISTSDFPKDMFDSYHGCSLLSANGLFESSSNVLENSDLIANVEYSPNQTPNTSTMPSLLPFQPAPIRDPNKLLQLIDISRIQACIYHDLSTESRQSQFLALSSLYFISVLMVSKYRDIIEPKQKSNQHHKVKQANSSPSPKSSDQTRSAETDNVGTSVGSIESNLLNFGKMQPTSSSSTPPNSTSALTDMLTNKLENTLDTICPLLKSIMCDFCAFLSKTLVGSHGQDLVNKEADRTFRRSNTSPVELVMLLCSQEWQNTLQKNAGLAFIELINEGRVLSHGMKDHIVRVAMEAEFILSRLRADDVSKHEHFNLLCGETQSARIHEEMLINSLISSAARRDYLVYCKFKEGIINRMRRFYKLDIWEDDDRRKRRFVVDSWDNSHQNLYSNTTIEDSEESQQVATNDTARMLELQQKIELGVIDDHSSNQNNSGHENDASMHSAGYKDEECCEDDYEDEEDEEHHDSNTPDSDNDHQQHKSDGKDGALNNNYDHESTSTAIALDKQAKFSNLYGNNKNKDADAQSQVGGDLKGSQMWEYDECSSVNDFAGSVVFAAECSFIWNIYAIPGVLQLTNHELHFEPSQNITDLVDMMKKDASNQTEGDELSSLRSQKSSGKHRRDSTSSDSSTLRKLDLKVLRYCEFLLSNGKILLNDIRAIFSRHYLLQPHALEIFLAQRTSVMFAFADFETVRRAIKYLPPVGVGIKYGVPQSRRASLMTPKQLFAASNMTQKWQKREVGNFQYLMFLNTIAGRTYQDLNQYPVFPWILTNYESEELDLNLPTNFRDLSKPVGALNTKRRAEFIERYQSWDNPKVPAFHYGTHYSTAAFTLNWLCRLRGSFNSAYLALQDGKYEESSRLFQSIGDSWVSSLVSGQQNVKELIPEFFYLPEMFHSNLGLPEVEYPPWAKSAEQFVRIHRLALESELVSCQLHQWIDLIFGYKQRGPEAVNAVNTFYYLTYQGNVNLNMVQDPSLREAIETQIKHFGQTPSQLTSEPHPPRFGALHAAPLMFSPTVDEINKVVKFPFNNSIVHISTCITNYSPINDNASPGVVQNANSSNTVSSIITITNNNQYQIHKWSPAENSANPFMVDPQLEQSNRRQLIDVDDIYSGIQLKLTNSTNTKQEELLDEVCWPSAHYVTTLDSRYIIVGSFYDNSFRVFSTENGKLCQVIYGHRGPITCMTRSDGNAAADFYLATGSQDCSLLLWSWNERYAQIEGSGVSAVHNPLPKLTITGHQTSVLSVYICAELGLIISGSKNLILVNTTTNGENLLEIDVLLPFILDKATFENMDRFGNDATNIMQRPQVLDKQKALLEASMLGDDIDKDKNKESSVKQAEKSLDNDKKDHHEGDNNSIKTPSVSESNLGERFSMLKELCRSDYYITNLQLARELAFIVCVALPPPPKRRLKSVATSSDSPDLTNNNNIIRSSAALLMTFNLKGSLMDSTTIGHAVNSPKLGDVCILQTTRDGEHLILNDTPTTVKIYRTFDLMPIYAYNTNDIPNTLSDDQNRVKSIAMLDQKFILVGLENGKIIVYNANFKSL